VGYLKLPLQIQDDHQRLPRGKANKWPIPENDRQLLAMIETLGKDPRKTGKPLNRS
jgi:hypothetical protein